MVIEPIILTIKDTNYKVEPLTQEIQAKFLRYVENQELQNITASKGLVSEQDYNNLLQNYLFKVKNEGYVFPSDEVNKYLNMRKHFSYLFFLCLNKHQLVDKTIIDSWIKDDFETINLVWEQMVSVFLDAKKNDV